MKHSTAVRHASFSSTCGVWLELAKTSPSTVGMLSRKGGVEFAEEEVDGPEVRPLVAQMGRLAVADLVVVDDGACHRKEGTLESPREFNHLNWRVFQDRYYGGLRSTPPTD
jgi:hypothetical protein